LFLLDDVGFDGDSEVIACRSVRTEVIINAVLDESVISQYVQSTVNMPRRCASAKALPISSIWRIDPSEPK